jgi:DNA-binding transcriptional LysR family regulator
MHYCYIMYNLNDIRPLCVLLEERHVSRAAARCNMTQPAMSRVLDRLRITFDDELLVRSGRTYERTPRAERLLAELRDIVDRLDAAVAGDRFDPAQCETTFRVSTTDYASVIFLPRLLRALERLAPRAAVEVTTWDAHSFDDVAAGRIDAAITGVRSPSSALVSERLFDDDYVCMVAINHPLPARRVDLESYLAFRHAVVDVVRGGQPPADEPLAALGRRRRVAYRTPFLGSAVFAVARTSMILTVPRRLAASYVGKVPVRVITAPRELATFTYSLVWHKRFDASLPHVWFRERIRLLARDVSRRRPAFTSSSRRGASSASTPNSLPGS